MSGGSLSEWRSLSRGGLCHGDPPIQWKSGWFTSYGNSFLFESDFILLLG